MEKEVDANSKCSIEIGLCWGGIIKLNKSFIIHSVHKLHKRNA
jgi:hypothetical protein